MCASVFVVAPGVNEDGSSYCIAARTSYRISDICGALRLCELVGAASNVSSSVVEGHKPRISSSGYHRAPDYACETMSSG